MRRRFQAARWLPLPALLLLVGGLALEIHIRGKETRARASLGGALGRVTLPITAGEQVRAQLAQAQSLVRYGDPSDLAVLLDRIAIQAPLSSTHELAAQANRAAGRGHQATRHWQLAARLAPGDAALAARADAALDDALLDKAQPYARIGGGLGLLTLVLLLGRGIARRSRARRTRHYLDSISGQLRLVVDDKPASSVGTLTPDDEGLLIDVFLRGRYGIRPPRAPRKGPTLSLALSNAGANRTIRVTPVHDVRHDAVRVLVKPATLARLRRHPGSWRVQATLGDRRIAIGELAVAAA